MNERQKGEHLEEAGDLEGAEEAYQKAVTAGEEQAELYLGDLLVRMERPAEAVAVLQSGIEQGDTDCLLTLGNAFADLGRTDEALSMYRKSGESGDPGGWHNYGRVLRSMGRYEDAIVAWRRAFDVGYLDAGDLASLLADAEHYDEAIGLLKQLWEQGDADALVEIGAIEQERGDLVAAERVLRLAEARQASEAYVYLANVLKNTGRLDEALLVLRRGADQGVASSELQLANELARCHRDDPEIEPLYRRALEHGDLDAENNLGFHLLETGRTAEGLSLLRRAAGRGDELAKHTLRERGEPVGS